MKNPEFLSKLGIFGAANQIWTGDLILTKGVEYTKITKQGADSVSFAVALTHAKSDNDKRLGESNP